MKHLLLGLCLVALVAGCTRSAGGEVTTTTEPPAATTSAPTSTTLPRPPRVAALGDSLLFEALDELRSRLAVATELHEYAVVGLDVDDARFGLAPLLAAEPEVLFVVLGTNNALDGTITEDDVRALDRLAELVSEVPCVRWVDVPTSAPSASFREAAADWNRALQNAADEHGFEVVPWADELAARPDWFRADGVHLTEEAQASLADALAASTGSCTSVYRGSSPR